MDWLVPLPHNLGVYPNPPSAHEEYIKAVFGHLLDLPILDPPALGLAIPGYVTIPEALFEFWDFSSYDDTYLGSPKEGWEYATASVTNDYTVVIASSVTRNQSLLQDRIEDYYFAARIVVFHPEKRLISVSCISGLPLDTPTEDLIRAAKEAAQRTRAGIYRYSW